MKEIIFEVLEDPTGGYTASALGLGIHTQADTAEDLKARIRDAVDCYFDETQDRPSVVRLHFVRDELIADLQTFTLLLPGVPFQTRA